MIKTTDKMVNNEVLHKGFFIVTAYFDMASYGDLKVGSFLHLENANSFGQMMKEKFLKMIPCNGALDEEFSEHEYEEYFYFKGVSKDGENFVTVEVAKMNFMDF
ncbi:hypothetical protein ACIQZG_22685 [Lysinibacillus sp. NPDC096418]|uniref:hypothetical protein n=1 Tax=Lysinibacillus sp. NPDC096418 TaxID=3364138 RepID=UPI00382C40EE